MGRTLSLKDGKGFLPDGIKQKGDKNRTGSMLMEERSTYMKKKEEETLQPHPR